MNRHYVGRVREDGFVAPARYRGHCEGYTRQHLVDHTTCPASVHMRLDLVEIQADGYLAPIAHAFEKGFYVLSGTVIATIDGRTHRLDQGYFGLIRKGVTYSLYNGEKAPARLLEMMAPQPKPDDCDFKDTWFEAGSPPKHGTVPDLADPRVAKHLGRFDESSLPPPGTIAGVGARSSAVSGISLKEFIDRMLGAQHLSMFLVQFQPRSAGAPEHDHPHEESFFFLSGRAEALLDGQRYEVGAGGIVWTGVGCLHSFVNIGDEPMRWIETQSPLPTLADAFRFRHEWEAIARGHS
jgi:mannose-6-phosphate isomerase-like protein (cupin superfamily)